MKILHVTTDYLPGTGGLERFVHDLARHSQAAGIDASVLAMNRIAGRPDPLPAVDTIDGVPITRVGCLDLHFYRPVRLPIEMLADTDVIHVHGLGAHLDFVAMTRRKHGRPIVLSTHGGIFHTERLAAIKSVYFAMVRRFVLPRVTQIVACGQADRDLFVARGVTDLITIDNGVDIKPWSGPAPERDPNRLLFVGRIAANKHIDELIRMVAAVRELRPAVTLRIVGPDRSDLVGGLKQLAADLGLSDAVAFVGAISEDQLASEYRQAKLFVSASRHEGFGISAVEAMAAGTGVLLNDIPAFRALVGDAPGKLTEFADPAAVIAALDADDAGWGERRAAQFAWPGVLPRWIGLYEQIVGAGFPRPETSIVAHGRGNPAPTDVHSPSK